MHFVYIDTCKYAHTHSVWKMHFPLKCIVHPQTSRLTSFDNCANELNDTQTNAIQIYSNKDTEIFTRMKQ